MKSIYYTLPMIALAVGVLLGSYWFASNLALGSVAEGQEYNATVVTSADVGTSTLTTLYGSLGSVVISSSSPAVGVGPQIAFYDTSSTTVATTSLTAFATIGANSSGEGTYTFDAGVGSGIMMWVSPTYNGEATVTWR